MGFSHPLRIALARMDKRPASGSIRLPMTHRILSHWRVLALALWALSPLAHAAPPPGRVVHVGFLSSGAGSNTSSSGEFVGIRKALADAGYAEGRNLVLDVRWMQGTPQNAPALATELVALKPDVIIGSTTPAVAALQKATSAIPIVMLWVSDPVGSGFVASLAHPGGMVTGASDFQVQLFAKWVETAQALAPAHHVGILASPANPRHAVEGKLLEDAARHQNLVPVTYQAQDAAQVRTAFARAAKDGVRMMLVLGGAPFNSMRGALSESTLRYRVGTACAQRAWVVAGCLSSYSVKTSALYRDVATYVDRIVNGQSPANLPVSQPREFELTINGKVADALGLTIPEDVRISAEVID